ncbi:MAG: B12-binding domain-containing radical SAM protein [Acidobacteria bacterium]|nr:MAG: B12-binding domain-containing radical SAM protein [Acidobacteriota bacterium]
MDLLLTHGYFLEEDAKEQAIMKPYVPLGILYLASHLRSRNFDVEVFDTTFASRRDLLEVLQSGEPAILGVYANLMTRPSVVRILQAAKKAGWKTIVGGPEPASYIDEYLAAGADVVVIGEGEVTLEELVPALRSGSFHLLSRVNGIAFRGDNGRVHRTPPRAQMSNIDDQPWPSRESVEIERYLKAWRDNHGTGSVSLITARGCPYECQWCSHAVYGRTHRRRKPSSVVDELEWIIGRYSPDMIWMADDVFTIHHGWLFQYAAEMRRRGLRIPFECISRADRLNPQIVALLSELGCFRIWIGSESGSQRVLDSMRRGVSVEQVQSVVRLCKANGIQTGMFLMWGYEGEELTDIEATINHVKRSNPDVFLTTVAYPIRGTPYFERVADRVTELEVWAEGSDRDFRIRGRHSRRFYQSVNQLLRAEVEVQRMSGTDTMDTPSELFALRQQIEKAREEMKISFAEVEA